MSVGVIFVHGMGETSGGYSGDIQSLLREYMPSAVYEGLRFQEVFYQDILQQNEERYFKAVKGRLDWDNLRRFMLYGFCDAASLESQKDGPDSPYYLAQKEILSCFKALHRRIPATAPMIVVAQSLGGQVMSNYLWDANKKDEHGQPVPARHGVWSTDPGLSPDQSWFCRGGRLARLFTTGCNIPLFVAGRDEDQITPISPPNSAFKWYNYYDRDDVLGWPLKQLSPAYADRVIDKPIRAGLLGGLTPMSHVNYWNDRGFLKPLANEIKRLSKTAMV
ncbi:MAG: hypothetical protein QNI84_13850 [Henriciella sp.]|nr:hypothetical protein [Henriciella sp.]